MRYLVAILLIAICTVATADDSAFTYREVGDFRPLSSYKSVAAFEAGYRRYVQTCLDHTDGGSAGIPCYIGYALWDRELNLYYRKLTSVLNARERSALKKSQRAWLRERDLSRDFVFRLDRRTDPGQGTMFSLIRAGDAARLITPIVKARALLLRQWYHAAK